MKKIIVTMLAFAFILTSTCMLSVTTTQAASAPTIKYQTHVQDIGWQGWKCNGEVAGTSGQSKRLEGMYIDIDGMDNAIEYRTHVQNIGWQGWMNEGAMTGTSGQSLRLEAIEIRLKGDMANQYDVYYRVHAQNFGWMGWAKNGQSAGTAGYSYRLEAIQIQLVNKGGTAPGSTATPFKDANGNEPTSIAVKYQTHVQNVGWQGWKRNGEMAGTSGQSLRLEGMYIEIDGADNAIEYRTHVQNIGWQNWVNEGAMTGTSGRSLRLEAIEVRLKGDMATRYDIYYRVHAQNFGWMDWAKNGQSAGTAGYSYRLEAIQIQLVNKGGTAPGSTATPFKDANGYEYLPDDYIQAVCDGVNYRRQNNGRYSTDVPVTLDPKMCEQAKEHALKMAKAEDIFHSGLGYAESVTSGASPTNGEGEGAMAAVHAPSLTDPTVIYLGAGAVRAPNGKVYLCVMGSIYPPK